MPDGLERTCQVIEVASHPSLLQCLLYVVVVTLDLRPTVLVRGSGQGVLVGNEAIVSACTYQVAVAMLIRLAHRWLLQLLV
jgi:hypothetical protein